MARNPTWLCVVAGALQSGEGRWLMHRRPPDKHHGGLWEFPGGKVEPGETPGNALVRELAEELGIRCRVEDLAPLAFADEASGEGRPGIVILLYTLRVWAGEPTPMESGAEIGWFTRLEMNELARPPLDVALAEGLSDGHPPE